MTVATIVVHFNDAQNCINLCHALTAMTIEGHEVIVVDNRSSGESLTLLKQGVPDAVRVLEAGSNLGFGGGVNFGLQVIGNEVDYVHLINTDVTIVNPDYLSTLVDLLDAETGYAMLGPLVRRANGQRQETMATFPRVFGTPDLPQSAPSRLTEVEVINGVCLLVRRQVLQSVGGFDPDYFLYVEEQDLCFRMQQAGFRCAYVEVDSITHSSWEESESLLGYRDVLCRVNQVMFMRKHRGMFPAFLLACYFAATFFAKAFMGKRFEGVTFGRALIACFDPRGLNARLAGS